MRHYSPLRYPGGKNKLSKFIAEICKTNQISGHYIEPYAGGASVALYLLINGHVEEITINDYDISIYAFWHSVLNETEKLCELIRSAELSIDNWKKQKEIQRNKNSETDLLSLGFSTLFLNRTNYSGIIEGGVIGGLNQRGNYTIDCRFNKEELIDRIKFIAIHRRQIHVMNLDAIELLNSINTDENTLFYFDPPYYVKGPTLYMNSYKHDDHVKVRNEIANIQIGKWIVSYDDNDAINKLYRKYRRIEYSFFHTARSAKLGDEVMFVSKGIRLPRQKTLVGC